MPTTILTSPAATYDESCHTLRHLYTEGRLYYIRTFGCQLNENDAERLAGILEACGMRAVATAEQADLIVLNTCSVRENADSRLFGNLGRLKALKAGQLERMIAVCGCMMRQPQHVEKIRRSYPFVDLVFGTSDLHRVPEMLLRHLCGEKRVYDVRQEDRIIEGLPIVRQRRFRALCTIMSGCNNFCSYCIVPYTRGRERSRLFDDVRAELTQIAAAGYREVMLLGQNVNSYGQDLGPDAPQFADLLAMAADLPGWTHVRFMTSHPKDISRRLIDTMAEHPAIERHLHLPLQSGSDRILREMNRGYTSDAYFAMVEYARARIPGLTISTDLIVGFPGETEADFTATLAAMERVRFDSAFTFQYSPREGTPAAKRTDTVEQQVVSERFMRMTDLQEAHSLASNQAVVGTLQRVLIEGPSAKPGVYTGRTSCNRLVNFVIPTTCTTGTCTTGIRDADEAGDSGPDDLENRLAWIRIERAHTFFLTGTMEGALQ